MILSQVLQIAIGLFVLGLLVLVHELGHFTAAKAFGVRVISFSIGFGRRLFAWRLGQTEYRISAIPFGGFVHMAGEHPEDAKENNPDEFQTKPIWNRAVIAVAGPLANYISAVLFIWLALVIGVKRPAHELDMRIGSITDSSAAAIAGVRAGDSIITIDGYRAKTWDDVAERVTGLKNSYNLVVFRDGAVVPLKLDSLLADSRGLPRHPYAGMLPKPTQAVVGAFIKGMPAARSGLRTGDRVIAIDSSPVATWSDLVAAVAEYDSTHSSLLLTVQRDDQLFDISLTPVLHPKENRYMLGMQAGPMVRVRTPALAAIPASVERSFTMTVYIFRTIGKLFSRSISPKELAGPVGIVQMSGGMARMGLVATLKFMALIGINLALLNLLPLVITDGGMLLFLGLEAVRGKPLPLKYQLIINQAAIILFVALFVYVTFNDVLRFPKMFRLGQ